MCNVIYYLLIEHADSEGVERIDDTLDAPLDDHDTAREQQVLVTLNAMFNS